MKYIIKQGRLSEIFKKFMDYHYDLKYNPNSGKIKTKDGGTFGYITNSYFYHWGNYSNQYSLIEMFGENQDELLLIYLRKRFPEVQINSIR